MEGRTFGEREKCTNNLSALRMVGAEKEMERRAKNAAYQKIKREREKE